MICVTPTLNLRPGMNSVAFFIYIINFSDFNLVSFMPYTYNIGMGLAPMMAPTGPALWQPHSPHSLTASFNLISINYDNVWGWMWIGKNNFINFIQFYLSLVMVKETFPHSYTSPHIHLWIFETLWVIIFWVRVTHKMLNVNCIKIHSINFIHHLSWLNKLSPTHTNSLISICEF